MIDAFKANNQKRTFELSTERGVLSFPYAKCEPVPTPDDPIAEVWIDHELGRQAITFVLESGRSGFVHLDQALDYNRDPRYMRDILVHELTVSALEGLKRTPLARREIMRRLGTSPAQFYRLIDPTNYRKSVDKMLELLAVLDCDVELVTHFRSGVA